MNEFEKEQCKTNYTTIQQGKLKKQHFGLFLFVFEIIWFGKVYCKIDFYQPFFLFYLTVNVLILRVSYITANIFCESRNIPNIDVRNYSIDLR